ncbi:MAG: hydrolase [Sphingomonas sp.]|nr:MAG: hydrolase [Sphingomonas sp.]
MFAAAALVAALPAAAAGAQQAVVDLAGVAAPARPGKPFAARNIPDRIILTPGADPSTAMGVSWRTDTAQATAEAEIVALVASPGFGARATAVAGQSWPTVSENGPATYHQARFGGLSPDTPYAYRVKGSAGWSEWQQFRTASTQAKPFTFIYLGDTQNRILDIGSIAWRRAIVQAGNPQLMLHAGDLVASRDDLVHDDEWGEWAAAGGWTLATIPQVPAPGNHEYVDVALPGGKEGRRLNPHWPLAFALPGNGAPGVEGTSYVLDWQGVRFVVLDGTSAIDLGTLAAQTKWLDAKLGESKARWNVVLFHQPIFTCARPKNTPAMYKSWKPVLERHRVDLVLQGHDHCYARLTDEAGKEASASARGSGQPVGPVYMVSVAGAKMYGLNDRSATQPDRVAEDSSLFQTVDVSADRLKVRSFLNTGLLYDGFDLVRGADGRNRLEELPADLPAVRRCTGPAQVLDAPMPPDRKGPDGLLCTAETKD